MGTQSVNIGDKIIGPEHPCYLIVQFGASRLGDLRYLATGKSSTCKRRIGVPANTLLNEAEVA